MGNYKSSISLLEESLKIKREIFGGSNMNDEVANALHNLGLARFLDNDFERGQEVLEKALSIRKDILGQFHVDVARTLDVLGKVYLAKNIFRLALNSHMEALEIKNKVLGNMSHSLGNAHFTKNSHITNKGRCIFQQIFVTAFLTIMATYIF